MITNTPINENDCVIVSRQYGSKEWKILPLVGAYQTLEQLCRQMNVATLTTTYKVVYLEYLS